MLRAFKRLNKSNSWTDDFDCGQVIRQARSECKSLLENLSQIHHRFTPVFIELCSFWIFLFVTKYRDKQTHTHIHNTILVSSIKLTVCLWTVEKNWSTRRKSTQTRVEHANYKLSTVPPCITHYTFLNLLLN